MKKIKPFFLFIITLLLASLLVGYFVWNKPRQNIEKAEAVEIKATDLYFAFTENEQAATAKYNGKILLVTGIVSSSIKNQEGKTTVQLQTDNLLFGVNCTFEKEMELETGTKISVKGMCSGFTTDVILIRCYLLKKST